ncbi:MAG: CDP-glycerol glycerophosphotransferase family protein, partial [Aristaeellaceae bacterium]
MGFEAIKGYFKQNRMFYLFVAPLFGTYRNHIMARARRKRGIDGNLVVFSSFDFRSYNDNPRYISEKLHELRPETDIVWLFRDSAAARKKFDIPPYVRALNSIDRDGVEAQACARVTVDNFNKRFYLKFPAGGQIYIQTWHGDRAFKKVGYDNPHQYTRFNRMLEEKCTLGVTGSDYGDMQFRSAFHYKGELLKVGYPRNDILLRDDPAEGRAIREK